MVCVDVAELTFRLIEAATDAVEAEGLETVVGQMGITPDELHRILRWDVPTEKWWLLQSWLVERLGSREETKDEAGEQSFYLLMKATPPSRRKDIGTTLLRTLAEAYHKSEMEPPPWLMRMLAELEREGNRSR